MQDQLIHSNQTFAMFVPRIGPMLLQGTKNETKNLYESGMTLINENIVMHSEVIMLKKGTYIKDVLNTFILQCQQHGFFEHLYLKHIHFQVVDEKDPNKVLTMYMLSAGFYLWLMSIAIACIVFVIEHVVRYFSRTRNLIVEPKVEVYYDELEYDVVRNNKK